MSLAVSQTYSSLFSGYAKYDVT